MHRKAHRGLAIASTLALLITAAGCSGDDGPGSGGASVPGVTDTEIVVGTHMPLTGPASAGYSKIAPATKAYFDYVNANGGVHGRTITYKIMDDGYNPANTQQVVRQLVLQDKVFAVLNGLGTPTHTGVLDFLKSNRVPDLFVASGSRSWDQPDKYPGTFGFNPDYTVEGKILANYAKTNLAGQKVCFLGQDDDFGRDSLAGVEKVLGAGAVAVKQTYVTSNTNVAPQIGAFKAAGCQVVVLATVPGFTALSVGTAARLGFKPQWLVSNVGADHPTLAKQLGAAAPLLEEWSAPTTCRCRTTRRTRGSSSSPRSTRSTTGTRRSTATPSTACRSATSSCRHCSPPARTSPGRRCWRPCRRAASRAPGWCRCASPPLTTPGTAASG